MKHAIRLVGAMLLCSVAVTAQQQPALPSTPLAYGLIAAQFQPDGTFTLGGGGWPKFAGTWTVANGEVELY